MRSILSLTLAAAFCAACAPTTYVRPTAPAPVVEVDVADLPDPPALFDCSPFKVAGAEAVLAECEGKNKGKMAIYAITLQKAKDEAAQKQRARRRGHGGMVPPMGIAPGGNFEGHLNQKNMALLFATKCMGEGDRRFVEFRFLDNVHPRANRVVIRKGGDPLEVRTCNRRSEASVRVDLDGNSATDAITPAGKLTDPIFVPMAVGSKVTMDFLNCDAQSDCRVCRSYTYTRTGAKWLSAKNGSSHLPDDPC